MEHWNCKPLISVGKIEFGMNQESVKKLFYPLEFTIRKYGLYNQKIHDYGDFQVYYAADDTVEAVEICRNIEVLLYDRILFPAPIEIITRQISGFQKKAQNYLQADLSIELYTNNGKLMSILIGRKGFFISHFYTTA